MSISAAQVKELRELTGAGMMDCKAALAEAGGDMEAAVDWLRAKGISKADKKAGRTAAEGLIEEFSEFDMNAILGMVNYAAIWIHRVPGEKVATMAARFTTIALQGITAGGIKS